MNLLSLRRKKMSSSRKGNNSWCVIPACRQSGFICGRWRWMEISPEVKGVVSWIIEARDDGWYVIPCAFVRAKIFHDPSDIFEHCKNIPSQKEGLFYLFIYFLAFLQYCISQARTNCKRPAFHIWVVETSSPSRRVLNSLSARGQWAGRKEGEWGQLPLSQTS